MVPLPDFAADLDAIQPRHEPIENSQPRCCGTLEKLPRLSPIVGYDHLMPSLDQGCLEKQARDDVIVGNQDFHVTCSPLNTASARPRWATSCSSAVQAGAACVKSPPRPIISSLSAASRAACAPKLSTVPFIECAARARA